MVTIVIIVTIVTIATIERIHKDTLIIHEDALVVIHW